VERKKETAIVCKEKESSLVVRIKGGSWEGGHPTSPEWSRGRGVPRLRGEKGRCKAKGNEKQALLLFGEIPGVGVRKKKGPDATGFSPGEKKTVDAFQPASGKKKRRGNRCPRGESPKSRVDRAKMEKGKIRGKKKKGASPAFAETHAVKKEISCEANEKKGKNRWAEREKKPPVAGQKKKGRGEKRGVRYSRKKKKRTAPYRHGRKKVVHAWPGGKRPEHE